MNAPTISPGLKGWALPVHPGAGPCPFCRSGLVHLSHHAHAAQHHESYLFCGNCQAAGPHIIGPNRRAVTDEALCAWNSAIRRTS